MGAAEIDTPLKGKTILVTGANTGMGKETARALARMGAHVIMLCRSEERGRAAQAEIRESTGSAEIDLMLCDLADLASIRSFAAEFTRRYPALHVLVHNAGTIRMHREESKDGVEMSFAVNHLAPFLLTHLLMDALKAGAPSRVIMVNSGAHVGQELDFDDLQARRGYRLLKVYGRSKLANLLVTYELARRLEGSGVTINALHPGAVATDLWVDRTPGKGGLGRLFGALIRPFFRTPEAGADTAVYLASSAEVEAKSGLYWVDRKAVPSSKQSYDRQAGERLFALTRQMVGLA